MLRITLVLFIVGGAVAQRQFLRKCPIFEPFKNFEVHRYNGRWYQFASYTDESKITTKCATATHYPFKNGEFQIKDRQTSLVGDKTLSVDLLAKPIDGDPSAGKFWVTQTNEPYDVLATDYIRYALVWSCTYSNGVSTRSGLILMRARLPKQQVITAVYEVVAAYDLLKSDFIATNKTKCPPSYFNGGK